uniref:RNase H type-1 domain-containing protein n=1 Tax=Leersia perrieri TaxID=77586 RepID=A0A0D9WNZ2_9ORYZ
MWALWTIRNKRRHREAPWPVQKAVEWAKNVAFDLWQLAHPLKEKVPTPAQFWARPPQDWCKCNTDGAFFPDSKSGATCCYLGPSRNFYGCKIKVGTDALMMKAMACREGHLLALQLGVSNVCLETDCQELIVL